MHLCILGVPGHTLAAVADLCRAVLGPSGGEVTLNDAHSTHAFLEAPATLPTILLSSFPCQELIAWLAEKSVNTIIVAPDIHVCMAHADKVSQEQLGLLPTAISRSLSCLALAREIPGSIFITGRNVRPELRRLRQLLMQFGDLRPEKSIQSTENRIISSFYYAAAVEHEKHDVSAVTKPLLGDANSSCGALLDFVRDGKSPVVLWPVRLFADVSSRARPAQEIIDLTGPARCLYWGPYLHLPAGAWEASVRFDVSEKSGATELRVEIYTETLQRDFPVVVPTPGNYEVRVSFEVRDGAHCHELRLHLERGEIEGALRFHPVRLDHMTTPRAIMKAAK